MKAWRFVLMTLWLSAITEQSLQQCRDEYKRSRPTHTACLPPNKDCAIEARQVSAAERELILETHNAYRSMVAMGKIRYLPEARNMLQLFWDEELASVAQAKADQCTADSGKIMPDEPEVRFTTKFNFTGQNSAFRASSVPLKDPAWRRVIEAWFNEYPHYPPNRVANFSSRPKDPTGHFTQVVWATTRYVGCGYASYSVEGFSRLPYMELYVCNYADAGNVFMLPVYKAGDMCSACPEGTACVKSTGLCSPSQANGGALRQPELPEARSDEVDERPTSTQRSVEPGKMQLLIPVAVACVISAVYDMFTDS
ncbi:hypothetical protein HPB50_005646 [Hyalomma asiaticum]|uniref:Uncharacterized protein n=1 Tax=Hyalomma asiaticum TaxID=266040 RepID=A0ACB7SH01_HYAAI|nr:hypothetical protein HPB50_005646 [Hyalomma asiaticum]